MAEMWPSSGGGQRWPIRLRLGGVANTEIERYLSLFTNAGYTLFSPSLFYLFFLPGILYTYSKDAAVSSTSFGSILIFASCFVGTCSILCG